MKTEIMLHCGNAPKMEKVIELTISLAKKDINMVKSCVREDFVWMTVGKEEAMSLYDKTEGQEHCLLKKYGDNKFPDNWDDFCRVISRMSGKVFR